MSQAKMYSRHYFARFAGVNENGQILPPPKIYQKQGGGKRILFFLPALSQKGESGLVRSQRKTAEGWLKSEHRECCVGGEKIWFPCLTEAFNYLG